MEAHDFDALLAQVAEQTRHTEALAPSETLSPGPDVYPGPREVSRWYLKETAETEAADAAESAREAAAAQHLSAFMRGWLASHPAREGVHYSDLFERYIYAVRDKPRRALQDWLPDYCYKTDDGGWRPPVGEEESPPRPRRAPMAPAAASAATSRSCATASPSPSASAPATPPWQPGSATAAAPVSTNRVNCSTSRAACG
jgi:hypothetical protein